MKRSNLKFIPTKKIEEILNDPYCRGIDGADYEPVKEELEQILWARYAKNSEKAISQHDKDLIEYEMYLAAAA